MSEYNGTPLPVDAGAGPTLEELLERLREVYSRAISDIVDRCLEEVLLPNDQASVCTDVAQFTTFLMAIKIAQIRQQAPLKENLMAAYWPMQKALKDEVPQMIREFAAVAAEQGQ